MLLTTSFDPLRLAADLGAGLVLSLMGGPAPVTALVRTMIYLKSELLTEDAES